MKKGRQARGKLRDCELRKQILGKQKYNVVKMN